MKPFKFIQSPICAEALEPRRLLSQLPDTPFGAPGWNGGQPFASDLHAQFGFFGAGLRCQTILSNGSILAAGGAITQGDTGVFDRFLVVKFKPNGTLDTSFGSHGEVTLSPAKLLFGFDSARTVQEVDAIALAPNGKILLGGHIAFSAASDYEMFARLNSNGSLDTTFGAGGASYTQPLTTSGNNVVGIYPRSDGSFYFAGNSGADGVIGKIKSTGLYDQTFGPGGFMLVSSSNTNGAQGRVNLSAFAVTKSGRLLACGSVNPTGLPRDTLLVAVTPSGTFDSTFHDGGAVETNVATSVAGGLVLSSSDDYLNTIALDASGRILVGGSTQGRLSIGASTYSGLIMRFHSNGTLDTSYGVNGLSLIYTSDEVAPSVVDHYDAAVVAITILKSGDAFAILNPSKTFLISFVPANGFTSFAAGDTSFIYKFFNAGRWTQVDAYSSFGFTPDGHIILVGSQSMPNDPLNPSYNNAAFALEFLGNRGFLTGFVSNPGGTIAGITVYIDSNHNGKLDPGEPRDVTSDTGYYVLDVFAPGTYTIRQIVPQGYRIQYPSVGVSNAISHGKLAPGTFNETVATGDSLQNDFVDTSLALISGTVLNDKNVGLANFTVYIDANHNGSLDPGETTAVTDSSGKFQFNVPAGNYRIREVVTVGYQLVAPFSKYRYASVASGQVMDAGSFTNATAG